MAKIWTMGEILVEIMRTKRDVPLNSVGEFLGPFPSGAPAIFIDTVAKLGHEAGIIGGVGDDDFGRAVINRLKRDGVNCDFVTVSDNASTAVAFVAYYSNGSRDFIYHVKGTPAVELHNPDTINVQADYFHVMGCSLMFDAEFGKNIIQVMEKFYSKGAIITFDPNVRKELLKGQNVQELTEHVLEKATIFLPGKEELSTITGSEVEEYGIRKLFDRYRNLKMIILKKGKKGATIYSRDGKKADIPPYPVKEVDPTGAGDCFDAAFICGIAEGMDVIKAGKMAAIAGALNTVAFGPMEGNITREEIEKRLRSWK
ncbi:sugar kinase [Thermotoga sp.]|uniref:sugar kinase n=1 Tax=Thermotoga sp. TaxID=28240 RepID=UPI0025FA4806|nr:sugar kinase [Thermotoga sp.]